MNDNSSLKKENAPDSNRELDAKGKTELQRDNEMTAAGKFYSPPTDIYETEDSLFIIMEMPGVDKERIEIVLDQGVLTVNGKIDFSNYRELNPVYTEYNVGHFTRRFSLSKSIDGDNINAQMADGVLKLELKKAAEAKARRIEVR